MRRAISIVLAAVMVTTPIKMVLAQADQRELQVAATDSTRSQTPTRIGVPVVEPGGGSALLLTAGTRDQALARDSLLSAPYRRASTGKSVLIVVGIVAIVATVILTIATIAFCVDFGC